MIPANKKRGKKNITHKMALLSAAVGESSLSAVDAINITVTPAALWERQWRAQKKGEKQLVSW